MWQMIASQGMVFQVTTRIIISRAMALVPTLQSLASLAIRMELMLVKIRFNLMPGTQG